nr:MAG TPA: hypothetical protein [Caudoviricetes sp.]
MTNMTNVKTYNYSVQVHPKAQGIKSRAFLMSIFRRWSSAK